MTVAKVTFDEQHAEVGFLLVEEVDYSFGFVVNTNTYKVGGAGGRAKNGLEPDRRQLGGTRG